MRALLVLLVLAGMASAQEDELTKKRRRRIVARSTGPLAQSEWVSIPDSAMDSLYTASIDDQWEIRIGKYPNSFSRIQGAWGGAVCANDRLYIWGGGHGDSAHNGVFSVSPQTGDWIRETMPSSQVWVYDVACPNNVCAGPYGDCPVVAGLAECGAYPDGNPASRHTYHLLATDGAKIYNVGGATNPSGKGGPLPRGWAFDLTAKTWTPLPSEPPSVASNGSLWALEGKLYYVSGNSGFQIYDIAGDAWTRPGNTVGYGNQTGMVYVPSNDRFYFLGDGISRYVSRSAWGQATTFISGAPAAITEQAPGLTYYPPEDLILIWTGGKTITTLNPQTHQWGSVTPIGEDPGAPLGNGTFGRFSYCGGKVALVNGNAKNLFYLKQPEGTVPAVCGNALTEPPNEQCDDGNTNSGDGCSSTCQTEVAACGNGVTQPPGEQCDDGGVVSNDGCSSTCQLEATTCGNGALQASPPWAPPGEQCDDGGTVSGDGCSSICTTETPSTCGNGTVEPSPQFFPGEQCDDGNTDSGDGCSSTCQSEAVIPPQSLVRYPRMSTPPGGSTDRAVFQAQVEGWCGAAMSTWPVLEVGPGKQYADTTVVMNAIPAGTNAIVRIFARDPSLGPYPVLRTKGRKCIYAVGVDLNGVRADLLGVNGTEAYDTGDPILPGGLWVDNLHMHDRSDCIGVPSSRRFFSVENSEINNCVGHGFITGSSSHHLYVRILNNVFHDTGSHSMYIDRVARADVIGNTVYNPGWGHAIRSVAHVSHIEGNTASAVGLDGTLQPKFDAPEALSIGMHPYDIYNCADTVVKNNVGIKCHGGPCAGARGVFLHRGRTAFGYCDVEAKTDDGTEWIELRAHQPRFMSEGLWDIIGADLAVNGVDSKYAFKHVFEGNIAKIVSGGTPPAGFSSGVLHIVNSNIPSVRTSQMPALRTRIDQYILNNPELASAANCEGLAAVAAAAADTQAEWMFTHVVTSERSSLCRNGNLTMFVPAPETPNWVERNYHIYGLGNQLLACPTLATCGPPYYSGGFELGLDDKQRVYTHFQANPFLWQGVPHKTAIVIIQDALIRVYFDNVDDEN